MEVARVSVSRADGGLERRVDGEPLDEAVAVVKEHAVGHNTL